MRKGGVCFLSNCKVSVCGPLRFPLSTSTLSCQSSSIACRPSENLNGYDHDVMNTPQCSVWNARYSFGERFRSNENVRAHRTITYIMLLFPKPKRIWLYCRGSVAYFVS